MPVVRVFAVQDMKAGVFHPPFVAPTEGVALRYLTQMVEQGKAHPYGAFPADYTVYEIGTYDEVNAELVASELRPIVQLSELATTQT